MASGISHFPSFPSTTRIPAQENLNLVPHLSREKQIKLKAERKLKMCKGTTTHMISCGHTLTHISQPCHISLSTTILSNPTSSHLKHPSASRITTTTTFRPCNTIIGPTTSLNDTCASCHPSILSTEINKRHDKLRERLMGRLRRAERKEEVLVIKEMIEEGARERSRELRNVGRVKWSGVVEWGGLGEGRREYEQYREPWSVY